MTRYFLIAPFEANPGDRFERVWQYDLANDVISIGWGNVGDVTKMTREELLATVAAKYPDNPPQTNSLIANMLWTFYHDIAPGDVILARRGRKVLAAVGDVTARAVFAHGRNPESMHSGYLGVRWREQPRAKLFPAIVFPMHTVTELDRARVDSYVEGSSPPPDIETGENVENPGEFVLEKYLEDFVVSNFPTIFKSNLELYRDPEGNDGQQYQTEVGPIDILAVDPKSKSFVVIELKKGRPSDQVVGQVLRYMGWVRKHLCTDGQGVRGLVICRDRDQKLEYAIEMTTGIDVRYYSVSFKLRETP